MGFYIRGTNYKQGMRVRYIALFWAITLILSVTATAWVWSIFYIQNDLAWKSLLQGCMATCN